VNPDSIDWYPLGDMSDDHIGEAKSLIEEHARRTGSLRARELLDNWETTLGQMLMIVPKEVASMLLARKPPTKKKQAERA
jgi:glutamate synthase (NADPH/NADH) large chain